MLCGYPPFYGQCGEDCGWNRGEACQDCQEMLFNRIQDGQYTFPTLEWSCISPPAKDLIKHLLVREPRKRYSAEDVLKHPWVCSPPEATPLATPHILTRWGKGVLCLCDELSIWLRMNGIKKPCSCVSKTYLAFLLCIFSHCCNFLAVEFSCLLKMVCYPDQIPP